MLLYLLRAAEQSLTHLVDSLIDLPYARLAVYQYIILFEYYEKQPMF